MARNLPIIDAGQGGVIDDGSESGVIKNYLASGNVVLMPFKPNSDFYAYGSNVASVLTSSLANATGTGTVLAATLSAGAGESQIDMRIKGRKFGLIFRMSDMNGAPISCLIDGVAYEIDTTWNANQRIGINNAGLSENTYQYTMIADDLSDGDHFVELVFPKNSSNSTRNYRLHGYIVDAQSGYVPPERGCVFAATQTIPAITSGVWSSSVSGAAASKGQISGGAVYGHIGYNITNDTGNAISFRAMFGSASLSNIVLTKTLEAGNTYEWRFPKTMYRVDSSIYWVASAAGLNITGIQAL